MSESTHLTLTNPSDSYSLHRLKGGKYDFYSDYSMNLAMLEFYTVGDGHWTMNFRKIPTEKNSHSIENIVWIEQYKNFE